MEAIESRSARTSDSPTPTEAMRRRPDEARLWSRCGLRGVTFLHARYHGHRFRPHSHDCFTVCAVAEGVEGLVVGGRLHRMRPGSLSLLDPGTIHAGETLSAEVEYRTVYLEPALAAELAGLPADDRLTLTVTAPEAPEPALAAAFLAAHQRLEDDDDGDCDGDGDGDGDATAELRDVLGTLLRRWAVAVEPDPGRPPSPPVAEALDYLHTHYDRPLALADLARRAGLSRFHFLRQFRRATGLPPHSYLIQYRVRRSKRLLVGGRPIADVALAVGFSDQSHFGAHFKSVVGLTPGQYVRSLAGVSP